jgi:multidrug efflux system membrane fusion protein
MISRIASALLCGLVLSAFAGCGPRQRQVGPADTPAVPVSRPVQREVTDAVEFTGRTDSIQAVDIRARVTGYLVSRPFKDGTEVKKGDLLFEIDSRPYKAQFDQAESQVNLWRASLKLAQTTLARDRSIASRVVGGVSQQQLDQDLAAVHEAEAKVKAAQSSVEVYKLNLDFTKVTSPLDGQISRAYLSLGNLVLQDQTLMTTVVALDPVHAYFDMDEPTLLTIRRAVNEGKIKRHQDGVVPVYMGVQGEEGFPHKGTINFVNNQVNSTTGSISVRGIFPNPKPANGVRLLSPGMFARVRLPIGQPHPALLVVDRAIASDQGLKYVYVLGADNTVEYRRVETGALQDDGLRVISKGLKPDEWVVVGGLQQVRPRTQIKPQKITMPIPTNGPTKPVAPPAKDKDAKQ